MNMIAHNIHKLEIPMQKKPLPTGKLVVAFDDSEIGVQTYRFPGGEPHVRLSGWGPAERPSKVTIRATLNGASSVIELLLATDAVRRMLPSIPEVPIELVCPYFPGSRQDSASPGEPLTAHVMASLINSQRYSVVEVWDVHSPVVLALVDRVIHREASDFVRGAVPFNSSDVVVSVGSDDNAVARARGVARAAGVQFVISEKARSPAGDPVIGAFRLNCPPIGDSDFVMVCDVCDSGRLAVALAHELRRLSTGKIKLYTTHGIFSSGFEIFQGLVDEIYTPNLFPIGEKKLPGFVKHI